MGTRRKLDIVVDAEYNGNREITTAANSIERLGIESDITAQKQQAFAARQKQLATDVRNGTKTIDQASQELKDYGDELERGIDSTTQASFSFGDLAKAGAVAGAAFTATAVVARELYETIEEGAALISAEQQFLALNESIGGSQFALMELRTATKGMISDSELMAGASELISLGIAKNQDEMVAWSKVVGGLNLDMQVLGLTLANNSKARLDSLGLSLEDVNKRTADYVAAGKSADEAFDLAVLDGLNERMLLLEDSLEGTASEMAKMEANWANVTEAGKKFVAEAAAPSISSISQWIDKEQLFNDAVERGIITNKELTEIINSVWSVREGQSLAIDEINRRMESLNRREEENAALLTESERRTEEYNKTLRIAQIEASGAGWSFAQMNNEIGVTIEEVQESKKAIEENRNALMRAREESERYQSTLGDFFTAALDADNALISYNSNLMTSTVNQDNINQSLFAAADAAGANATELALLGIATGQLSEQQAEAALKSAAMQAKVEELGVALAEGMDPQEAINKLNAFSENLEAQDFSVRLGIDVDEGSEKASEKSKQTFEDFRKDAEGATDDAKSFFGAFSEDASGHMVMFGESVTSVTDELWSATDQAGKLKDMIIDGLPDEKVITIRINTVGSVPNVGGASGGAPGGNGSAATATAVAEEMAR